MAHKKGQGSIKNGRDSNAQFRGVKKYGGERVEAGNILVRQCGSHFWAGEGAGCGKDFTIFATRPGIVRFFKRGPKDKRRAYISVDPLPVADAAE